MQHMRHIASALSLCLGGALAAPLLAHAHVKWFTDGGADSVPAYSLTDWPVVLWIAIGILVVFVGIYLQKHGPSLRGQFARTLHRYEPVVLTGFTVFAGLALIFYAVQGFVFAPNLVPESVPGTVMRIMQAVLGLMLVFGFYIRLAGVALLGLYWMAILHFGFLEMIDALEIVGIGVFLIAMGRPVWKLAAYDAYAYYTELWRPYALPLLRIFLGMNLVALGLAEKILRPDLGVAFLQQYEWNFMPMLGFPWFTDYWFIFSAGAVEVLLGIMFMLGIVTRLTTLTLTSMFILSNIVMAQEGLSLGLFELAGHTPHIVSAMIFLVYGAGHRLVPFKHEGTHRVFMPIQRTLDTIWVRQQR